MSFTLYGAIVPPFQRMLVNVLALVAKAEAHCASQGISPETIIDARIAQDMFPFAYQIKSTATHSIGAIEGVRKGVFSPDRSEPGDSFAALTERVTDAQARLALVDEAEINALVGQPMRFEFGAYRADFTADQFLLTFSVPNFYFHATTAYDILRGQGLAIGKLDYLGKLPLVKQSA